MVSSKHETKGKTEKKNQRKKSETKKSSSESSDSSDSSSESPSKNLPQEPPKRPAVLDFQICDWNTYHEIDGKDEESYVIQLFGRTEDDKDVCLKVTGFTPFFYVEVPETWNAKQANNFVSILKRKVKWSTENNPDYEYDLSESLIRHRLVQKHKFYNFSNKKLFKFVMLIFKSHTAMREYASVLSRPLKAQGLTKEPMLYQRYESNIEPHIRFMHINNLSSCGWATVDKSKLKLMKDYSYCDYSYSVDWKDVCASENDDRMAPFKIMGYDIECISCDHNFPQANRKTDKIIQIGNTMYRYGSMNCYEQHILTLKDCASIKGATVESYKSEKALLRGWAKKVRELRPDFKAGYNNFGFDDEYIFDRISRIDKEAADSQGINVDCLENKFMDEILEIMGKVNNSYLMEVEGLKKPLTHFKTQNLSSSALGDNELKYIQVPGILSVDMMKIIQRDHRLVGYKLDNVSANFITEEASKFVEGDEDNDIVNINIYTQSTKALEKDSYIQIMVDDSYSSSPLVEGAKYYVSNIETITETKVVNGVEESFSYQCISTQINKKDVEDLREVIMNPLLKIYWTFAKDDMHHTLINKYFKEGDPSKIRQIAKYCLKDCKLVNLLLAKLDIIVNSIGMAKVCHVPLSYIFLRGQGVKIFSLVSKKCREKNYLIPVLRRKKTDVTGDEEDGYEGAEVITPKPKVYLSPIGVLDYSSLYPNSMRERNLSQECYVNNLEKYDNLPGYTYHDVHIILKNKKGKILRNIDGTPQKEHHRFAQELISEEQINEELKDIFGKINADLITALNTINSQKYFTQDNCKDKIANGKGACDKKVKEISANKDLSDADKKILIEKEKEKFNKEFGLYLDVDSKIKREKDRLNNELKDINDNKKLSLDDKKQAETSAKSASDKTIGKYLKELVMSDDDRIEFINTENDRAKGKISQEKAKKYNVVNGQTVRYGILPEILTELLNKRKETNIRLGATKDPTMRTILNGLQLAFKITANSLYGQTGAPTSPIFFMAIAASTTAVGRERLRFAKRIVEENFPGSEIIYGDSVTGDTPIICRNSKGDISIRTIEALGTLWESYDCFKAGDSNRRNKQQSQVDREVWTSGGWSRIKRVIRHKTTKKIYRVLTPTGCIDVTEDHSLLDKNKAIIKPADCVIGTELLHGFMDVSEESKPVLDDTSLMVFRNKIDAQKAYFELRIAGFNVQIDIEDNKFVLRKNSSIENPCAIKSIEYLRNTNSNEYVYDLETENGTFHAGIGELIVKNTDSIFINFHLKDADGNERTDRDALAETIELCQKAAAMICAAVPKPQGIVYEKTMHPFILVAKKKYVGLLYEKNPDKIKELKSMGIVLKRRDNAPIVKIVVGGIINHILKNRDIDGAVKYVKEVLRKVMDGAYPIDKFIISKTLKARYKKPSTIAHKVLADRMAVRDPGNKPQINDRIPFVYVITDLGKKKKKDILQGDLIEHPEYVVKNGLKIDYLYYLEHQIINPASQILELMLSKKRVKKLFDTFIIEEQSRRLGRQSMEKWMYNGTSPNHGSKTAKIPTKTLKNNRKSQKTSPNTLSPKKQIIDDPDYVPEPAKRENKYENVQYIGNTKRIECQTLNKWMDYSKIPNIAELAPNKSTPAKVKISNPNADTKYDTLLKKGKTKELESVKMAKWIEGPKAVVTNSDDWEPEF